VDAKKDAQKFGVEQKSRRDQAFVISVSLFFLAAVPVLFWAEPQFRTTPGYAIGAGAFLFCIWALVRELQVAMKGRSIPLVIDPDGIRYASPGEIAWSEIGGLEPVPSLQRVDLLDLEGNVRVSIRYDLEDAEDVIQFVADVLADRWPHRPLPHDFVNSSLPPMLAVGALGITVIVGAIFWMINGSPLELVGLGTLVLVVLGYLIQRARAVQRLIVTNGGLTVARGLGSRVVRFGDVEQVGIALVNSLKGDRHLGVRVKLGDDSDVDVLPLRCDPFDVYATIKAAFERTRATTSAGEPESESAGDESSTDAEVTEASPIEPSVRGNGVTAARPTLEQPREEPRRFYVKR
jgi:hypothetical protein